MSSGWLLETTSSPFASSFAGASHRTAPSIRPSCGSCFGGPCPYWRSWRGRAARLVVANLFLIHPVAHLLLCSSLPYSASQFRANSPSLPSLTTTSCPGSWAVCRRAGPFFLLPGTALFFLLLACSLLLPTPGLLAPAHPSRVPGSRLLHLLDQNVTPGEEVKALMAEVHLVLPARPELSCLLHKS